MKKFCGLILTILFLLVFSKTIFSQTTISVIGKGTTKEEATQDALRNAVEKATGVFVYSTTEIKNFKLVQDKIVAASKGYVKDYKITDEKNYEGIIILTVEVTVDTESIKTILRQDLKAVTYDDVLKDYNLITQKMDKLKKSAELLKAITTRPITEMYDIDYVGYEIKDIGLKNVKVNFFIRVSLNPFFWDTYEEILEQISDEGEESITCGIYKKSLSDLEITTNKYKLHPDLEKFLIGFQLNEVKLIFPNKSQTTFYLGTFKNLIVFDISISSEEYNYSKALDNSDYNKKRNQQCDCFCASGLYYSNDCSEGYYCKGENNDETFRFIDIGDLIDCNKYSCSDYYLFFNSQITFTLSRTIENSEMVKYFNQLKLKVIE